MWSGKFKVWMHMKGYAVILLGIWNDNTTGETNEQVKKEID